MVAIEHYVQVHYNLHILDQHWHNEQTNVISVSTIIIGPTLKASIKRPTLVYKLAPMVMHCCQPPVAFQQSTDGNELLCAIWWTAFSVMKFDRL